MPIKINGSASGYTEIKAPDTAPNNTLTLPSTSGTLMTTGGTNTFTANQVIEVNDNSNAALRITQLGTGNALVVEDSTNPDSTPFIVDASGNVGIGTTSMSKKFVVSNGGASGLELDPFTRSGTTGSSILSYNRSGSAFTRLDFDGLEQVFFTSTTERMRIDSSGSLYLNGTSADPGSYNVAGCTIGNSSGNYISITRDSGTVINANRKTNDGQIIAISQDGLVEGSISVSGTTVSYNSFAGSHWSQLSDNSRPNILRGTVCETIDEKCSWPDEDNDQLAKFKVSDIVASKRVYGVFMSWDNDDDANNDAYITGVGAYLIRIASGVTVSGGDLLESNGDGCARVQSDDIIRSSTVAKVTCNIPTETYADGSYTVPCVLYCG